MFEKLLARGFELDFRSHAKAILSIDFPDVATEIEDVLLASAIPIEEIIGSGGGEAKGTQRLRNALKAREWKKHNFVVQRVIDGIPREAQSHEVDHIRTFDSGTVALEIEWNNTPPYRHYDRCAGSLLDGRNALRSGSQARPGVRGAFGLRTKSPRWSAEWRAPADAGARAKART